MSIGRIGKNGHSECPAGSAGGYSGRRVLANGGGRRADSGRQYGGAGREYGLGRRAWVIEYAEIDEIAIPNSIPTAEGALRLAMEGLPITIHGCCCFVLGLGRVGLTTARLFSAVGAETWVVAEPQALQARAMRCPTIAFAALPHEIGRADLVINTVPAMVVPEQILALTKPSVSVIDLASAPGGIDFRAAETLRRQATLALGIPGRFTPVSAGRILAEALPAILLREMG